LLRYLQEQLNNGKIEPNQPSKCDHIFCIIAHAGNQSNNGPVLKYLAFDHLRENGYEFYSDLKHGNFLVRLKVNKNKKNSAKSTTTQQPNNEQQTARRLNGKPTYKDDGKSSLE
jgi:hypothetical protein